MGLNVEFVVIVGKPTILCWAGDLASYETGNSFICTIDVFTICCISRISPLATVSDLAAALGSAS